MRDLARDGRGIDQFVGGNAGQRAAGHVAHHVAAGALGRKADRVERVHNLRQRLDGEPVQLNVLADGDVGQIARVFAGDSADQAQLAGRNHAVGNADAHHEPVRRQPLAAFAAGSAHAVALGVDAPPFEVGRRPFGHYAGPSLARERTNLVKGLPGILFALQALHALGFGLFLRNLAHFFPLFVVRGQNRLQNGMPASALAVSRAFGKPWFEISGLRPRLPVPREQHAYSSDNRS